MRPAIRHCANGDNHRWDNDMEGEAPGIAAVLQQVPCDAGCFCERRARGGWSRFYDSWIDRDAECFYARKDRGE